VHALLSFEISSLSSYSMALSRFSQNSFGNQQVAAGLFSKELCANLREVSTQQEEENCTLLSSSVFSELKRFWC
jgi:hypothetical protein